MEKETMMLSNETDAASAYSYLMEWQWPEHIESLLRRLLFLSFSELAGDADERAVADSDALGAKAIWLISVYPKPVPAFFIL
jgi:hypothetical protein